MINILDKADEVITTAEENLNEAAPLTNENTTELKNETIAAAQDAQEQNAKTTDNIQGYFYLFILSSFYL
jgi:hypothetical protein